MEKAQEKLSMRQPLTMALTSQATWAFLWAPRILRQIFASGITSLGLPCTMQSRQHYEALFKRKVVPSAKEDGNQGGSCVFHITETHVHDRREQKEKSVMYSISQSNTAQVNQPSPDRV